MSSVALKLNSDSSSDSPDLDTLLARYSNLERPHVRHLGSIESPTLVPLPFVSAKTSPRKKARARFVLSAGIHGDEPAGVFALIEFLESAALEFSDCEFLVFPCLNPVGFVSGHRRASTVTDLNRVISDQSPAPEAQLLVQALADESTTYSALFDLHEDNPEVPCEFAPDNAIQNSIYLYEASRCGNFEIGKQIIGTLRAYRFEISDDSLIYGEPANDGVIFSNGDYTRRSLQHLENFALQSIAERVITLETPKSWSFDRRVRAHVVSIKAGIEAILSMEN